MCRNRNSELGMRSLGQFTRHTSRFGFLKTCGGSWGGGGVRLYNGFGLVGLTGLV